MPTVSVQIGNGDDKLTQAEWHGFVVAMKELVERSCSKLHFFGAPENWREQQNAAFIFDIDEVAVDALKGGVIELRKQFRQESAAWTAGLTEFV
jgi:hypothetical protein